MNTTAPAYRIRGRHLDQNDLAEIRQTIAEHWAQGRSKISRILCHRWQWRQANGQIKDQACRSLLLTLEKKGEITLPPRLLESFRHPRRANRRSYVIDTTELAGPLSNFGPLILKMVRRSPDEGLWDYLVDRHHYLGSPWIVGSYLKYLAYLDGRLVACLGWGSAAWKVAARDQFVGWSREQRESNLAKVVDNVRFLVLPWVRITHLASKALALNTRYLQDDWFSFYGQRICLLETFVDTSRFQGTCYRAANWIRVGETTGRGKYDRFNQRRVPIKAVFLYPLSRNFREALHA